MSALLPTADSNVCVLQLRLSPEQNDAKRDAEQAVKEVEDEVLAETDESKQEGLKAELASRKEKLSALMDGFQVRWICALLRK